MFLLSRGSNVLLLCCFSMNSRLIVQVFLPVPVFRFCCLVQSSMQPRGKRAASPNESAADDASPAGTKKLKPNTAISPDDDDSTLLTVDSFYRAITTALAIPHTLHTGPIDLLIPPLCRVVAEYAAPFVTTRRAYRYRPAVAGGEEDPCYVLSANDSGEYVFATRGTRLYSLSLRPGKWRVSTASCHVA